MSLLSKNIRIRFRFCYKSANAAAVKSEQTIPSSVTSANRKEICRVHVVDLCSLSTVRSVASRYLQKALSEPSSQCFEIISVTTGDGYEMPLYESAHIFRDDDMIQVLYSVNRKRSFEKFDSQDEKDIKSDDGEIGSSSIGKRNSKRRSRHRQRIRRRNGSLSMINANDNQYDGNLVTDNITSETVDVSSVWQYLQLQQQRKKQKSQLAVSQSMENSEKLQSPSTSISDQVNTGGYWYPVELETVSFSHIIKELLQKGSLVYYTLKSSYESSYGTVDKIEEKEDGQVMLTFWITSSSSMQEMTRSVLLHDLMSLHVYKFEYVENTTTDGDKNFIDGVNEKDSSDVIDEGYENDSENVNESTMTANTMDMMYLLLAKKAQFELSSI